MPSQASKSKTLAAVAVVNSIKQSIASSNSPATYSGAQLDGAIGQAVFTLPQTVSVTLSSHANSYTNNSTITFTGLDTSGNVITDVLTIPNTGGGVLLNGVKFFTQIQSIALQAQADALGNFQFGTQDALYNSAQIRCGGAGDLHVKYASGATDTILSVAQGEQIPVFISVVFGDSTATKITGYYLS